MNKNSIDHRPIYKSLGLEALGIDFQFYLRYSEADQDIKNNFELYVNFLKANKLIHGNKSIEAFKMYKAGIKQSSIQPYNYLS